MPRAKDCTWLPEQCSAPIMCTTEIKMCPGGGRMPRAKDCTWLPEQCSAPIMCTAEIKMCPGGGRMPRAKDCTWLPEQCKIVSVTMPATTTAVSGLACNPKDDKWKRGAGGGSDGRPFPVQKMCPMPSYVAYQTRTAPPRGVAHMSPRRTPRTPRTPHAPHPAKQTLRPTPWPSASLTGAAMALPAT